MRTNWLSGETRLACTRLQVPPVATSSTHEPPNVSKYCAPRCVYLVGAGRREVAICAMAGCSASRVMSDSAGSAFTAGSTFATSSSSALHLEPGRWIHCSSWNARATARASETVAVMRHDIHFVTAVNRASMFITCHSGCMVSLMEAVCQEARAAAQARGAVEQLFCWMSPAAWLEPPQVLLSALLLHPPVHPYMLMWPPDRPLLLLWCPHLRLAHLSGLHHGQCLHMNAELCQAAVDFIY